MLPILHALLGADPTSSLKSAHADGHVGLCRILSLYPPSARTHARMRKKAENPTSPYMLHAWPEVRLGH